MYDPRIVMDLVHRYGRACGDQDYARAGVLFSEIVRAIRIDESSVNDEEAWRPSEMEDRGASVLVGQ